MTRFTRIITMTDTEDRERERERERERTRHLNARCLQPSELRSLYGFARALAFLRRVSMDLERIEAFIAPVKGCAVTTETRARASIRMA